VHNCKNTSLGRTESSFLPLTKWPAGWRTQKCVDKRTRLQRETSQKNNPLKRWHLCTRLHGVTPRCSENASSHTATAVLWNCPSGDYSSCIQCGLFVVCLTTLFQQQRPAVTSMQVEASVRHYLRKAVHWLIWCIVTTILPPSAGLQSAKWGEKETNLCDSEQQAWPWQVASPPPIYGHWRGMSKHFLSPQKSGSLLIHSSNTFCPPHHNRCAPISTTCACTLYKRYEVLQRQKIRLSVK
jgi:hypothetical protein